MREIKFRYVFRRKQDGHIWMLIVPIEAIEDGSSQLETMLSNELWELISRDQFTGLKDKGGVEIYERDVCLAWFNFGPGGDQQRVTQALFDWHGISLQHWAFEPGNEWALPKVIGNPHENKDLLK